jgi:DNA-binding FrmR family transcriptional regulator/copper chaperone CopZ
VDTTDADGDQRKGHLARLGRIEGQVRGIRRMIEQERACAEVLPQLRSVINALCRVQDHVLHQHLRRCVRETFEPEARSATEGRGGLPFGKYRNRRGHHGTVLGSCWCLGRLLRCARQRRRLRLRSGPRASRNRTITAREEGRIQGDRRERRPGSVTIGVTGMHCAACVAAVGTPSKGRRGQRRPRELRLWQGGVDFDPGLVTLGTLETAIRDAGYEPVAEVPRPRRQTADREQEARRRNGALRFQFLLSAALGLPCSGSAWAGT